jgi:hypothetical protein
VRERIGTIIADIESAWKRPKLIELTYRFSSALKGVNIVLWEGSLRAKNKNSSFQLVVVKSRPPTMVPLKSALKLQTCRFTYTLECVSKASPPKGMCGAVASAFYTSKIGGGCYLIAHDGHSLRTRRRNSK